MQCFLIYTKWVDLAESTKKKRQKTGHYPGQFYKLQDSSHLQYPPTTTRIAPLLVRTWIMLPSINLEDKLDETKPSQSL